jgi:dTDP-4-amino-4,6-dideoxygalactose transaminase
MKDLHQAEPIPYAARKELERILETGDLFRYHGGVDDPSPVALLEQEFADMMGAKFALAVASCSAALFLTLKALDLPDNAKVLVPAFTFAAVPSAIVHANLKPVLVECSSNYRMDMDDFEAKLTDDISAVLVSHMRGHTSDMDILERLCKERGIPLIEDAAHSLGTTWNGRKIGTIGVAGCFSFQSYKLLNAGEGGILITDDEDLIARAVVMSGAYENNWQKHLCKTDYFSFYQNALPLYNTRLSNLAAVVVRPQLAEIPRRAKDGYKNYTYMAEFLKTSKHIDVPAALAPEVRAPDSLQFNLVGFSDEEAYDFLEATAHAGLPITIFGLHKPNARVFWNWKFLGAEPDLPMTRDMLMRACDLRLPPHLSQEHLDTLVGIILGAIAKVKNSMAA